MAKRPKYGGAEECPGCLQPVYPMERVSWAVASSSAFESFVFVIVIAIVFVFVFITAYLVERVSEFNCKFCICFFYAWTEQVRVLLSDIFTPRDWCSGQYNAKEEGVNQNLASTVAGFLVGQESFPQQVHHLPGAIILT